MKRLLLSAAVAASFAMLITTVTAQTGKTAAAPRAAKPASTRAAKAPAPGYPYGYLPPLAEALARSKGVDSPPDLKESFNGGPEAAPPGLDDAQALAFCYAPTIWPDRPGFPSAWRTRGQRLNRSR